MNSLYEEKISILKEVLDLTQSVAFSGNDDDADKYVDLIETREGLIGRAKEIDRQLATAENITGAQKYTRELGALARQIVEQDNYMKATVLKILDNAKTDIKNVNTGKHLNNLYGGAPVEAAMATDNDWSQ